MILGRPVLPPDVGALSDGPTTVGSGPSASAGSARNPTGTAGHPAGANPTTSAGATTSRIAASSRAGSRGDTGCGTAPSFQTASAASTNAIPLGRPIVT